MRGNSSQQHRHDNRSQSDSRDRGRGGGHRSNKGNSRRDRDDGHDRKPTGGGREKSYGVVLSLKESFGFILPYSGDEHIYFNERDAPYDIAEKDEVEYVVKSSQRGPAAVSVRVMDPSKVQQVEGRQRGVVSWEADPYKVSPGTVALGEEGAHARLATSASFLHADVDKGSRRVMKGDEVEFDLFVIPNTSYAKAKNLMVLRTKRDRLISDQIRMFEEAGVKMEQGVIDTIKGREFGFIKACDRADHLFFRLDDIIDQETLCNEGDEVEFYVISEHTRGKLSDRAVHISYLPHGSVSFERTLAESVLGTVVTLPRISSRGEEPGTLLLHKPVSREEAAPASDKMPAAEDVTGGDLVETVELWARCLSEGMSAHLRLGDELRLDVTHYRPEKLIFARNVSVEKFFSVGRCFGTVCDVKVSRGFGFLRSAMGDVDAYFRIGEVVGADGQTLEERAVVLGMNMSYDVIIEEVKGGGESKLRAVRVREEALPFDRKVLLKSGMRGVVQREAKKDASGIIEMLSPPAEETKGGGEEDILVSDGDVLLSHKDMMEALQRFADLKELRELVIEHMVPNQRFACHSLVRAHFPGIAHQTISKGPGIGKGQSVRLWKIDDDDEYRQWATENHAAGSGGEAGGDGAKEKASPHRVRFQRGDVSEAGSNGLSLGAVRTGAPVAFDLCLDRLTAARVAARVEVSDQIAAGGEWPQVGVVEFTRGASDGGAAIGGYIRCVPSDEKLPWLSSCVPLSLSASAGGEVSSGEELQCGAEVCFEVRNRGGVRYASRLSLPPSEDTDRMALGLPPPLSRKMTLEGSCVGVVVAVDDAGPAEEEKGDVPTADGSKQLAVFPLVFSGCPELANKAPDIVVSIRKVLSKKSAPNGLSRGDCGTDDTILWQKKVAVTAEDAAATESASCEETCAGASADEVNKEKPSAEESSSDVPSPPKAPVTAKVSLEGVPVYYPPLPLLPIPLTAAAAQNLAIGSLVEFRPVVNWGQNRGPIGVVDVRIIDSALPLPTPAPETPVVADEKGATRITPLSSLLEKGGLGDEGLDISAGGLTKGVIIRLKISNTGGLDLTEIACGDSLRCTSVTAPVSSGVKNYYCYHRDLKVPAGGRVSVGDEVEFLPVTLPSSLTASTESPSCAERVLVAVCPSVMKSIGKAIVPPAKKRVPVNASLKQATASTSAFKNIVTMAAGPEDGGGTGFAAGWRTADGGEMCDVSTLPWGPLLLRHLMSSEASS